MNSRLKKYIQIPDLTSLPTTKKDKQDADWFIALQTVGFFATKESARSARENRDELVQHAKQRNTINSWLNNHTQVIAEMTKIGGLKNTKPKKEVAEKFPLSPLQESLLEGFVNFRR